VKLNTIIQGDTLEVLKTLPSEFVDCIVTSPPWWGLRDYKVNGQIGLEPTLEEYLEKMLAITAELRRVLKRTGVMFWNHDTNKLDLCCTMQNYRLAIRMMDEQNWIMPLKGPIIWYKPNYRPDGFKRGFTHSYEPIFMFVKSKDYWFDVDAVRLKYDNCDLLGKILNDVWAVSTQPSEYHTATFPEGLIKPMIESSCPQWICKKCGHARKRISKDIGERTWVDKREKPDVCMRGLTFGRTSQVVTLGWSDCGCGVGWRPGVVLDPFMGSGTTAVVATKLGRNWLGIELNPDYIEMAKKRLLKECGLLLFVSDSWEEVLCGR